ncbi:MAG: hypothetical protein ACM31C_26295 [Acidobacteriota bacterium]
MVRTRGWLVAGMALGLLGATACKKDKGAASADKTTDKGATGDKGGIGGQIGDDLSLLPVDSELVVGINFAQVQQSALWKQFVAPKLATADLSGIQKFKALCGFDPLDSLKSVAVGMKGVGGESPVGAIVIHGFDKSKSMACFDKDGVSEVEKDGSKVTIDGDVVMITDKSGKQFGFTFVNDTTALAVMGPDAATKDGIKKVAAGGTALKTSPAFVDMYKKINTGDSLWLVAKGDAPFMAKAAIPGAKLKAAFGSLNITDGLSVDFRLRLGSPDEATQLVSMAKGQIDNPQAKQFFDKIEVTADGPDVKIAVAMSAEKLKQLAAMVGGLMGGMMGGGMGGAGGPGGP